MRPEQPLGQCASAASLTSSKLFHRKLITTRPLGQVDVEFSGTGVLCVLHIRPGGVVRPFDLGRRQGLHREAGGIAGRQGPRDSSWLRFPSKQQPFLFVALVLQ